MQVVTILRKIAGVNIYECFRSLFNVMLCYHNRPREISGGSHASFVGGCYEGCSVETPQVAVTEDVLSPVTYSP
jgi:hypothetical protein